STGPSTWMNADTSVRPALSAWRLTWRRSPCGSAKYPWSSYGLIAPPPNNTAKKRAARGCKRPKSREETPKEGSGNSRYRSAISYLATHKNQGWRGHFLCYFCMACICDSPIEHVYAILWHQDPRSAAGTRR